MTTRLVADAAATCGEAGTAHRPATVAPPPRTCVYAVKRKLRMLRCTIGRSAAASFGSVA